MYFNDGLEGIDTHAMEDRIPQDTGVVYDSIELAVGVDRHLDDFACWQSFCDGFEIRDDFFGGCGAITRTVGGYAGIIYDNFGTLCGTEKCDLTADATPRARDDDDLVA